MECQVVWNEYSHSIKADVTLTGTVHLLRHTLEDKRLNNNSCRIQSFCTPSHIISVVFDKIPLSAASILVQIPPFECAENESSPPKRVHYGVASNSAHEWNGTPRDEFFTRCSSRKDLYCASLDLTHCKSTVLGISFVIQLQNSSWLKSEDGSDFYIGGGSIKYQNYVEIPFLLPKQLNPKPYRLMSLFRHNMFWLRPQMNLFSLSECHDETQLILMQQNGNDRYACLLMAIDRELLTRATLFGLGSYTAIRIETGRWSPLYAKDIENIIVCHLVQSTNPYDAISQSLSSLSDDLSTFSRRIEKISTPKWRALVSNREKSVQNSLGFCTWDAFGDAVSEDFVVQNIKKLQKVGYPIGYMLIDDGWQAGGTGGQTCEFKSDDNLRYKPRLTSFGTNEKFSSELSEIRNASDASIFLWMTSCGYWGGVSGSDLRLKTCLVSGAPPKGLSRNRIEDIDLWRTIYESLIPTTDNLNNFYKRYFEDMTANKGVKGVKIDGQGILELLCNIPESHDFPTVSRASLTRLYRQAIAKEVDYFFATVAINCMACNPESLFCSGEDTSSANICWRTSDDHAFPGIEENAGAVGWHILSNAMNTLLVGEIFPIPDWDMFRLDHNLSKVHAIARVISGGPIYFSDVLPFSEGKEIEITKLVQSLVTSEGYILRCDLPGRPTRDSLFLDPREYPYRLFKVFNRTSVLGVLAIFNLTEQSEGNIVQGEFCPCDIDDFYRMPLRKASYVSMIVDDSIHVFFHNNGMQTQAIELPSMSGMLIHISPVLTISSKLQFAVLGQPHLLNAGAVVESVQTHYSKCEPYEYQVRSTVVVVNLRDFGKTYIWMNDETRNSLSSVQNEAGQDLVYLFEFIDKFELLVIQVPQKLPYIVRLSF